MAFASFSAASVAQKTEGFQKYVTHGVIPFLVTAVAVYVASLNILYYLKQILAGDYSHLGTLIFCSLYCLLFIIRKPTVEASRRWGHWFIAITTTMLPVFFRPVDLYDPLQLWVGIPLQVVATSLCIVSLNNLGKSFGVIAARREIKTRGFYEFVRHPLYASEILMVFSILLQNLSLFNAAILIVCAAGQVARLVEEEKILSRDPQYVEYTQQVRYRLIPGIF